VNFGRLLELVGDEPVFESALLLAGGVNPGVVRLQFSRWTKHGRLYQLRRGLYAFAPPYQKVKPHPFLVANRLQHASYVSGQSALSFYGLIPELVHTTLSVTTGRPERLETPLGAFEYRHIKPELLCGYRMVELTRFHPVQQALVATPEKALLDLVYLQAGGASPAFLEELRLQNLEQLNLDELHRLIDVYHTPKLRRAVEIISRMAQRDAQEYETL
jgi:predicted transcriptional regulator of viral defense system